MTRTVASFLAPTLAAALLAAGAAGAQQQQRSQPQPQQQQPPNGAQGWRGCCGLTPWAAAGPMTRPGGEGTGFLYRGFRSVVAGSTVRHHVGLSGGIPAAYANLHNPLPPTPENVRAGAAVYEAQCESCHGATGLGDGPGSKGLTPPPAELGWLTKVPGSRRDAFMYWSTAEGGQPFGTGMPAFKGKLSDQQIWSVVGYIQARLPPAKATR
jgi:mono/diheme cytochrome c family protein